MPVSPPEPDVVGAVGGTVHPDIGIRSARSAGDRMARQDLNG